MTAEDKAAYRLKPMRGFFSLLTPEQKAKVLAYRGPDEVVPIGTGEIPESRRQKAGKRHV